MSLISPVMRPVTYSQAIATVRGRASHSEALILVLYAGSDPIDALRVVDLTFKKVSSNINA